MSARLEVQATVVVTARLGGEDLAAGELRAIVEREQANVARAIAIAVNSADCDYEHGQRSVGCAPDGIRRAWLYGLPSATVMGVSVPPSDAEADRQLDRRLEHAREEL